MKKLEDYIDIILTHFSDVSEVDHADGLITVDAKMDFPNVYALSQLQEEGLEFRGMLHELYVFKCVEKSDEEVLEPSTRSKCC